MKKGLKKWQVLFLVVSFMAGSAFPAWAETEAVTEEAEQEETAVTAAGSETENEAGQPVMSAAFFPESEFPDVLVTSMEDAAAVVEGMADRIGQDERTIFEPWRSLTDSKGNNYYVFRQMYDNVTVSGGAVKVVTDPSGKVLGLVSSVESEIPDTEAQEGIFEETAEKVVAEQMEKTGHSKAEVIDGFTEKVILPVNLEIDMDSEEEKEEVRFVWVVYTNNDTSSMTESSELPYLAHYVTMDGEYLYSLPTIIPNDETGNTGFQASYIFEFMEPVDYTGTVMLSDGTEQEITVSLMRDSRTGMYYLGNLERRIVVADCYEFLYNKGNVILEASKDNTGWDNTCLLSLYNYCRAWDYYNEIGWKGGDGLGTPMMILKDFCDKEHEPINNAAYAGSYYGWQLFISSSINDFSQCLDVLAHEFTHCVTGSVMTYNAYSNDYGAINEAISDIQGNLCEMMAGATEDTTWMIGDRSKIHIRSMSDPHKYRQPEFSWDVHYTPNVKNPTAINDRGGVHSNSSLLNRIAWMLCTQGGMTYEEARDFWFAVDCSMVPGTDYAQLSILMPWVLKNIGLEQYLPSLEEAIAETRIDTNEVPSSFDPDRALIRLKLPETENFEDGNWGLYIVSVDADEIMERIRQIINKEGEYAGALDDLGQMMKDAVWKYVFENGGKEVFGEVMRTWAERYLEGLFFLGTGAAGADGRTIQMVGTPGYTIPILLYLKFEPSRNMPSGYGQSLFINGQWIDVLSLSVENAAAQKESGGGNAAEEELTQLLSGGSDIFFEINGGQICEIPSDGLENIKTFDFDYLKELGLS